MPGKLRSPAHRFESRSIRSRIGQPESDLGIDPGPSVGAVNDHTPGDMRRCAVAIDMDLDELMGGEGKAGLDEESTRAEIFDPARDGTRIAAQDELCRKIGFGSMVPTTFHALGLPMFPSILA
jgi:hypothetical protein